MSQDTEHISYSGLVDEVNLQLLTFFNSNSDQSEIIYQKIQTLFDSYSIDINSQVAGKILLLIASRHLNSIKDLNINDYAQQYFYDVWLKSLRFIKKYIENNCPNQLQAESIFLEMNSFLNSKDTKDNSNR